MWPSAMPESLSSSNLAATAEFKPLRASEFQQSNHQARELGSEAREASLALQSDIATEAEREVAPMLLDCTSRSECPQMGPLQLLVAIHVCGAKHRNASCASPPPALECRIASHHMG